MPERITKRSAGWRITLLTIAIVLSVFIAGAAAIATQLNWSRGRDLARSLKERADQAEFSLSAVAGFAWDRVCFDYTPDRIPLPAASDEPIGTLAFSTGPKLVKKFDAVRFGLQLEPPTVSALPCFDRGARVSVKCSNSDNKKCVVEFGLEGWQHGRKD